MARGSVRDAPRLVVVGTSGSGKTTLARRLAERLAVPHVELDAIYHGPGWTTLGQDELRARVAERTRDGGWIVDGNHRGLRDVLWPRADAIVWLDLPRPLVMARVIARTARRAVMRPVLWNGNRQRLRDVLSLDPSRNVVALAWTTHDRDRRAYREAVADPRWARLRFVHLTDPQDSADAVIRALR